MGTLRALGVVVVLCAVVVGQPVDAATKKGKGKPTPAAPQPLVPPPPVAAPPPPPLPPPSPPPPPSQPPVAPAPAAPVASPPHGVRGSTGVSREKVPAEGDSTPAAPKPARRKAMWQGFFLSLNVGYATAGGTDGPAIPELDPPLIVNNNSFATWRGIGCLLPGRFCYAKAVTSNKGDGLAAALQIGYNIKGFVSLWADISWHGSFGAQTDTAGNGTIAAMLGLHPIRFARDDLPFDVRLYAGYGFVGILYYFEAEFQDDAKAKAWFGTAVPFGLALEYKLDEDGAFALGADLRAVAGSYTKWMYNNDKNIASNLVTPEKTFRLEPRLSFGWHF